MHHNPALPAITLSQDDHRRLLVLAMVAPGHTADDSDYLNHELDRATVVPGSALPLDIARVGSRVTYRSDLDPPRTVTLVYPAESDLAAGRISVLSRLGTSLIGLQPGQSIRYMGWDGDSIEFSVLSVLPPAEARR